MSAGIALRFRCKAWVVGKMRSRSLSLESGGGEAALVCVSECACVSSSDNMKLRHTGTKQGASKVVPVGSALFCRER